MKRERTSYDRSFKIMAVELAASKGSIPETAKELGIPQDLIRRWTREKSIKGTASFSGNGIPSLTEEQKEIERLKRELKEAQIERDILKKAVSIFSKNDGKYSNS
jgi:transposase